MTTLRKMYDSVTVADLPDTAAMVAGYVDGHYKNIDAIRRRFPHAVVVGIATRASTNDGIVLDVEPGDATAQEAVGWVVRRRHAGHDPSVYCAASEWNAVRAAFHVAGVAEPHYWIAQWDGNPQIPAGAIAKQYRNAKPGEHYDVSSVHAYWPGVDMKPAPAHFYVVKKGDTLSEIAERYHMPLDHLLYKNPHIHNPNLIYPGQHINV
jgi:nucleoid-associated protein YgaU